MIAPRPRAPHLARTLALALALALTAITGTVTACAGDDLATSGDSATTTTSAGATTSTSSSETTGETASATTPSGSDSAGATDSTTSTTSTSTTAASTTHETTAAALCDAPLTIVDRDLLTPLAAAESHTLAPCEGHRWYFVGASESTLELTLTASAAGAQGVIAYPDRSPEEAVEQPLVPPFTSATEAPLTVSFEVPRSGEFALDLRPEDPEVGATYTLAITCVAGCDRETTRFPILWVHGWTGFENIGPLTYFYGIRDHLEPLGFPMEFAILDPYNSSQIRGAQLAPQIDGTLQLWRARKIDLIGHSQGGIDSRYAIASLGYGDRVSALVTIGSPHRGTYIMDLALGLVPGPAEEILALLLNLLGALSADAQSDAKASFYSLSEAHMEGEFNPQNPDDPAVTYISYTGTTCAAIDFLDPQKMCKDYVDPLILWGYNLLKFNRGPNDGLVTVDSAKWGDYRGEMIADHIDEVGQIAGLTDPDFDHRAWYLARVRDLAAEGH